MSLCASETARDITSKMRLVRRNLSNRYLACLPFSKPAVSPALPHCALKQNGAVVVTRGTPNDYKVYLDISFGQSISEEAVVSVGVAFNINGDDYDFVLVENKYVYQIV